ncbi:hypothetical protein ACSQ67_016551 [Phaseolus vulgaris]
MSPFTLPRCRHRPTMTPPSAFRTFAAGLSLRTLVCLRLGNFKLKAFSGVALFRITCHVALFRITKVPMPHNHLIHVTQCNLEQPQYHFQLE